MPPLTALLTRKCCVALRRDLRQVGHAQHLALAAQRPQFLADDFGDRAADAAVHFVEDHRRHASRPSAATSIARLIRASSPPEATLRKGRGGWPGLAETRNSQRSAPCGFGLAALVGRQFDGEDAARHAQLGHQGANGALTACRPPVAREADSRRGRLAPLLPWRHRVRRPGVRLRSPSAAQAFEFVAPAHRGGRPVAASAPGACAPGRAGAPIGSPARSRWSGSRSRSSRRRSSRLAASSSWIAADSNRAVDFAQARFVFDLARRARRVSWRRLRATDNAVVAGQSRQRRVVGREQAAAWDCRRCAATQSRRCRIRVQRLARQFGELVFQLGDALADVARSATARRSSRIESRPSAAPGARTAASSSGCWRRRHPAGPAGGRVRSKAWCSCWPWISTRRPPSSASCARVAGRPLIQAREPPSARITRRSWQLPPSSSSFSRSQAPRLGGIAQVEFGGQLGAFGAMADHAASARSAGQDSRAHRPAAICRRRFRPRSRSVRDRRRVRRR